MLRSSDRSTPLVSRIRGWRALIFSLLQYTLALGASANLIDVNWQLGTFAILSFSSDNSFQPLLWMLAGFLIHVIGAIAVFFRFTLRPKVSAAPRGAGRKAASFLLFIWSKIGQDFRLCNHQPAAELHVRKRIHAFYLFSWLTSTLTIAHIVYGTLIFSSSLFIGTEDAVIVFGRQFGSVILCRIILMIEIRGISDNTEVMGPA